MSLTPNQSRESAPGSPRRAPSSSPSTGAPSVAGTVMLDPMRLVRQYYRWLVGAAVVGMVLGTGSFIITRKFAPRWDADVTFRARAGFDRADDPGTKTLSAGGQDEMDLFIETHVLVLRSNPILQKVLDEREVQDTKWAQQFTSAGGTMDRIAALKELRKIVSARRAPATTVIRLTVGTKDKYDSAAIAGAISDVFLADVQRSTRSDMIEQVQQFENEVRSLRKDLESLDQRIEALLGRNQLTSLRQESTVAFNEVQSLRPALVELSDQYTQADKQLKTYEEIINRPGGKVYPESLREEVERSPGIMQQDQGIVELKAVIRSQLEHFGPSHRVVQNLQSRLRAMEQEREDKLESLLEDRFQAQLDNLRNTVANLNASREEMNNNLIDAERKLADVTLTIKQYDDLQAERNQKLEKMALMEKSVTEFQMLEGRGPRVQLLQSAQAPDAMAFPSWRTMIPLGVFLSTGLVALVIAFKEIREQRVRGPADLAAIGRTRLLGVVPEIGMDPSNPEKIEGACRDHPHGAVAESIRAIRTALLKECQVRGHKVVLLVGGLPGAGATALLSNLGINAAASDVRVLLIDANLRRPAVHRVFGLGEAPGLTDVLMGESTLARATQATALSNLSILSAGKRSPEAVERFTTPRMANLLREARESYDLVLIDSSPGVVSSDAMALAGHADGVVLVVRAYAETRGLVARLRNQFAETHAEFIGVILNAVRASAGGYFKRNYQATHDYAKKRSADADESESTPAVASAPGADRSGPGA